LKAVGLLTKSTVPSGNVFPHALTAGTMLRDGTYRLGSVLGQGGFGITYRASDVTLQREVAVKEFFPLGCGRAGALVQPTITSSLPDFEEARAKFLKEARVLARFRHPGIVQVYAVWEENGTAYFAMEMLHGRALSGVLEEHGRPLDEAEVLPILRQVLEALAEVHVAGLLHRDIKPDNIMLTDLQRAVLIDFGAAKEVAATPRSQAHSIVVTPGYAPLEQYARRARRGAYTDIYALCATMYHLLGGEAPPAASDRAVGVELVPLRQLNPNVSHRVAGAIEQGLQTEIDKRPQTVPEFLALLQGQSTSYAGQGAPAPAQGAPGQTKEERIAADPVLIAWRLGLDPKDVASGKVHVTPPSCVSDDRYRVPNRDDYLNLPMHKLRPPVSPTGATTWFFAVLGLVFCCVVLVFVWASPRMSTSVSTVGIEKPPAVFVPAPDSSLNRPQRAPKNNTRPD
jgi:serine/threonine protein kinase